jgi:hypothetical protein
MAMDISPHSLIIDALVALNSGDEELAEWYISKYSYDQLVKELGNSTRLSVLITEEMRRKSPYKK